MLQLDTLNVQKEGEVLTILLDWAQACNPNTFEFESVLSNTFRWNMCALPTLLAQLSSPRLNSSESYQEMVCLSRTLTLTLTHQQIKRKFYQSIFQQNPRSTSSFSILREWPNRVCPGYVVDLQVPPVDVIGDIITMVAHSKAKETTPATTPFLADATKSSDSSGPRTKHVRYNKTRGGKKERDTRGGGGVKKQPSSFLDAEFDPKEKEAYDQV